MFLQEGGRNQVADRSFDGFADDAGFALAPGHQIHFLGFVDGSHTHRDGTAGYVLFAEEIAGGIATRQDIQGHHPGFGVFRGAWLVETDVTGTADAQDLNIDSTRFVDLAFVVLAEGVHIVALQGAVRNVNVCAVDIHMVEQLLVHETDIALKRIRLHREILVEIERDHVLETEPFLFVQTHQFGVHACGARACSQAEHGKAAHFGTLTDQSGDVGRNSFGCGQVVVERDNRNPLELMDFRSLVSEWHGESL